MRGSIVIPSYNSKERLYLNLVSLNHQTYSGRDVEVIVVDNGSTDGTGAMLETFQSKWPLSVIRVEQNRGIAAGRNAGIRHAAGDILFFHDSDMIAAPEYIERHLSAHTDKKQVVCGVPWKRVYSFYYKGFRNDQFVTLNRMLNKRKEAPNSVLFFWPDAHPLLSEKQVADFSFGEQIFDLDIAFIKVLKGIASRYGPNLEGYHLPWRFFITNNL